MDSTPPNGDPSDGSSRPPAGQEVIVFAAATNPEGMVVKGLLEAEGIPVSAKGETEGPYRLGPVFLWVPSEYEELARQLIHDATESSIGLAPEDPGDGEQPG